MAATPPFSRWIPLPPISGFLPRTGGLIRSTTSPARRDGACLHLQSLPLREGGDRPARRRRADAHGRGHRLRRDLLQRRRCLSRGLLSRPCSASPGRTRFRSRICTTKTSRSRGPMAPSAHRTFSAMTRAAGSNTVAASMKAAPLRRRPARAGSWSRPCAPLRRPAWRRPGKCRRSAAPSSGSRGRVDRPNNPLRNNRGCTTGAAGTAAPVPLPPATRAALTSAARLADPPRSQAPRFGPPGQPGVCPG